MGATLAARASLWIAAALTAAFWVLITAGGVANPGYRQYKEFISGLSAAGAQAPAWGIAALVCLGLTHLVLAPLLWRWQRTIAATTVVAGMAAVGVALVPMTCPSRAGYCVGATGGADVPHAAGVLLLAAATVAGVAAGLIRLRAGRLRTPAVLAIAALAVALAGPWLLTLTGLEQRLLVLAQQGWLIAVALIAREELRTRQTHRLFSHNGHRITAPGGKIAV